MPYISITGLKPKGIQPAGHSGMNLKQFRHGMRHLHFCKRMVGIINGLVATNIKLDANGISRFASHISRWQKRTGQANYEPHLRFWCI